MTPISEDTPAEEIVEAVRKQQQALAGRGTGEQQLLEVLDVLADAVKSVTVYDAADEDFDHLVFTATWQVVELALQALLEYRQALDIVKALHAEAQEREELLRRAADGASKAADSAERTASGLIVPSRSTG